MWGVVRRQLTCPQCGVVLGDAMSRRLPPALVVTSTDGLRVVPESVGLQLRREKARAAAGEAGAADRVTFLERHLEEMIVDLRCRNGHSTLRTMPQLARAVRRAGGQWVDLRS